MVSNMNIDTLIEEYREANPINSGPFVEGELEMLQRRMMHLTGIESKILMVHFQTEDGKKVRNFIREEIEKILRRMGRDETTILYDLLNLLVQEDIALQKDIMNQALSELELT